MRPRLISAVVVCGALVLSLALTASPEQQGTRTPGEPTEAHVRVDNRGGDEAIPVDVRDVHLDRPLHVQIINGEAQYTNTNPVQVRAIRSAWEYRTISILPGDDAAAKLNPLGLAGWEVAGNVFGTAQATTVLLKRPR